MYFWVVARGIKQYQIDQTRGSELLLLAQAIGLHCSFGNCLWMSDWPPPNCQSSTAAEPTMPCVGAGLYDAPGAARIYDPRAMYRGRFKERSGHRVTNEIIGWWEDGRMKIHLESFGYGSIPISTIFRGMNIHLPAILMWTKGVQGFDTLPFRSFKIHPVVLDRTSGYQNLSHTFLDKGVHLDK